MSQDCAVGVYESLKEAGQAVRDLDESGFPADQVSLVTFQVTNALEEPSVVESGDEAEKATTVGAATGGLLGLLLGAPLLAVPGVGAALVAGPLAIGLTGALVGGLLGSMRGWGVHDDHIAEYQKYVDDGKMLVVASGTPLQVADAYRVMQESDSIELNTHQHMSADAPGVVTTTDDGPGLSIAPNEDGDI